MNLEEEISIKFKETNINDKNVDTSKILLCMRILKYLNENQTISLKSIQTLIFFVKKSMENNEKNNHLISLICQCISRSLIFKNLNEKDSKETSKIINQSINTIRLLITSKNNNNLEGIGGTYTSLFEILSFHRKTIKKSEIDILEKIMEKNLQSNDENITQSSALVLIKLCNSKDDLFLLIQRVLKSIQSLLNLVFSMVDDNKNNFLLDTINDDKIKLLFTEKKFTTNEYLKLFNVFSFIFCKVLSFQYNFELQLNPTKILEILFHSLMDFSYLNVKLLN
jgi:hypothetical protein